MTAIAFVGTYTDADETGVFSYRVADDTLARIDGVSTGRDPSYLRLGPDAERLYVVEEADAGRIRAFAVDGEGGFDPLNDRPTGDAGPCHCSVAAAGDYVFVAHYAGGSVGMHPLGADGRVGERSALRRHEGASVHPKRQDRAHPHAAVAGPDDDHLYVPDLGTDSVVVYGIDRGADDLDRLPAAGVDLHDGAGPRHLVFHPEGRVGYLVGELDSTVTVLHRDPDGALTVGETVSTLPGEFAGDNVAADVHLHPAGDRLYVSNRGHDSVAVYRLEDPAAPEPAGHVSTRGRWPRGFGLTPDGRHLLSGVQHDDELHLFGVADDGLDHLDASDVPAPACVDARPAE